MFSFTVIAETNDELTDFAPYVGSVDDHGTVAFQAALAGGGAGVFTGNGGAVREIVRLAAVTSHPDLNNAGETCFYGEPPGVFLVRDGRIETIADAATGFTSIGPLGPTMNEAGVVAFRAERAPGVQGIFAGDETVADTDGPWSEFHGLPVINAAGTVAFRADRTDGVQGVYTWHDGSVFAVVETGEELESLAPFPSINDGGTVGFGATLAGGGAGIFIVRDGEITRLDTDAFESCRSGLVNAAGAVFYVATPPGGSLGVYAGKQRILGGGDELSGSTVTELAANPVSINARGQVAIRVRLADDRQLIVRADPA
jgi:hypothetical protein